MSSVREPHDGCDRSISGSVGPAVDEWITTDVLAKGISSEYPHYESASGRCRVDLFSDGVTSVFG